jgi:transmembrane 9 superfamily protein 2/4
MLSLILARALHKDISRYNATDAQVRTLFSGIYMQVKMDIIQEDVEEDYGWKLVHGDVFRPPNHNMMLSVLTGSGLQLVAMTGLTLVFSILGFLSPSNRGSLATVMLIFFMFFSSISGYTSARCYKMNNGERWKMNIFLSAVFLPG